MADLPLLLPVTLSVTEIPSMVRLCWILLPGILLRMDKVRSTPKLSPEGRIFDGTPDYEFMDSAGFSDPLFYDVRFDLPEDIIRNKRDSRFFPGTQPAGVKGITKELLQFIKHRVNPLGFEEDQIRAQLSSIDGEDYQPEYF